MCKFLEVQSTVDDSQTEFSSGVRYKQCGENIMKRACFVYNNFISMSLLVNNHEAKSH